MGKQQKMPNMAVSVLEFGHINTQQACLQRTVEAGLGFPVSQAVVILADCK